MERAAGPAERLTPPRGCWEERSLRAFSEPPLNALFLDEGEAHGLYAPELGRSNAPGHGRYRPIIRVIN